jgi:L-ascorbate metabolism protein UlaG (beta-lactamase superfamily)
MTVVSWPQPPEPSTSTFAIDSLTYIGHATTLVRLGEATVLTDPMLRRWLGPLRRQAPAPPPDLASVPDAVLVSHLHRDHLDLPSLRRVPATIPVVLPRGAAEWARKAGAERVLEVGRGETVSIGPIQVMAVPAAHDGRRGRRGGEIEALGYVIRGDGRTVYFAGDTDLFDEMSGLPSLDLALLPVWGWGPSVGAGHLNPETAARAAAILRPRLAVPIHWGTLYPAGLRRLRPDPLVKPPREFARLASELAPDVEVRVLQPGSETPLGPS